MCGRFSLFQANDAELIDRFHASRVTGTIQKRYNIAPTQDVLTVLNEDPATIFPMRWGLVPFWAKDPSIGNRMINARAETVAEKAAFRGPIRSKRCLVLADGFYEWKRGERAKKRPFRIFLKDNSLFAFAGIWDIWGGEGKELYTCAIITTEANALVRQIHDRMPVILRKEDEERWLKEQSLKAALNMLSPYDAKEMGAYEISDLVNAPSNDFKEVAQRVNEGPDL